MATVAGITESVYRRLGSGDTTNSLGVEVELSASDVLEAISNTCAAYSRFRPRRGYGVLTNASPTTSRYSLTSVVPNIVEVVDVNFISAFPSMAPDPFDYQINGVLGLANYDTTGTSDLMRYLMAFKDGEIIFSTRPSYRTALEYNASLGRDELIMYCKLPMGTRYYVGYAFTWAITPDDTATGLSRLPPNEDDWFLNYTVATCKEMLGRIRGKFGGITNDSDGTSDVDGRQLLQEGMDEREKLTAALMRRRAPALPVIG